jgi:asparagine synthase (glutamine-hydrolysing)
MCGIIGAFNHSGVQLGITHDDIHQRMARMQYRGPDAQDTWNNSGGTVILGHLRLSILDPRPEGTQPMHYTDANGTYTIAYNGEVYNYLEIKEELIQKGYSFNTGTDTEVILKAFAAWGQCAVQRFNGMFAIAIYNDITDTMTLIRDRLGIKPVYYKINDESLIFASEVKAIRDLGDTPTLYTPNIHSYMEYGYTTGEQTMDRGILRLMPGHILTLKSGEKPKVSCYWYLNRPQKNDIPSLSFDEAVKTGRELFADALKLRMRADVPVGVFLSGGLDSSAVVAMLSEQLDRPIQTFSVRYDIGAYGEEYDESVYAEQVSKQFGTEHHTFTMTAEDFEKYIPQFVSTMDEPVTEAAALSLHFVSELAKDHVTVVLSGEGSDELFAGYDLYQYMQKLEQIRTVLTPLGTSFISGILSKALPNGSKIKKYAQLASKPFEERYKGISVYDGSYATKINGPTLTSASVPKEHEQNIMQSTQGQDIVSRMLQFDTQTWLVDDLLIKADRMSMGSSLELRVPFLDYRMVEFAASLPTDYKIRQGEGKYILKKMMEGKLPDNIIYREKKGFPTPLARMFAGPLKDYVKRTFLDVTPIIVKYELFLGEPIKELCEEHWAGTADHHRILWQLIVLEEWFKQNYPDGI